MWRIFTWLCIYYKDPLSMVLNFARNVGNAPKEGLKMITQWVVYYFTNPSLGILHPKCHDPVGYTGIQMLSPVLIAPQSIQKMRD